MAKIPLGIEKVDKFPVPLLIVGLGGTGRDAVIAIKEKFAERFHLPDGRTPERTAYLVFDTESDIPDGLDADEYRDFSVMNMGKILMHPELFLTPYERTWVNRNLGDGMSRCSFRQVVRLMLSRQYMMIELALREAISSIVPVMTGEIDPHVRQVEVVIVTSVGGSTGSGIFLDMAQIIRHVARKCTLLPVNITGYMVMPDVHLDIVRGASGMERPIKHNAYAALKELDFWMRVREHKTPYTMKYGAEEEEIVWSEPPFNQCVLMSKTNFKRMPFLDGYDAVLQTITDYLLHYLVKGDTIEGYSIQSYEDNLASINIKKTQPAYYGYRAIGGFTNQLPKKQIFCYEGKLLFKTFMPQRNERHFLTPDDTLLMDGMGEQRALSVVGEYPKMCADFFTNMVYLPSDCSAFPKNTKTVTTLRSLSSAPHTADCYEKWRNKVCTPMAQKAATNYADEAWNRFVALAESVFTDPNKGPFALHMYIENWNGLLHALIKQLDAWKSVQLRLAHVGLKSCFDDCEDKWQRVCNPPLFGEKKAVSCYMAALKSFYEALSNNEFMTYHIPALEKVILRIKEYLNDSLRPLCDGLEMMEDAFDSAKLDIFGLTDVHVCIDALTKAVNDNNRLTVKLLNKLMTISLEHTDNTETTSSGWTFNYHRVGMDKTREAIDELLKEAYGTANNQLLDQFMADYVGYRVEEQAKWMKDLIENSIDRALPMFLQDGRYSWEGKIESRYMFIPQNETRMLDLACKTDLGTSSVSLASSALTDHIYCLTVWDKLPLYRYGLMEELRSQYYIDLHDPYYRGMHLVRTGMVDADYKSDWSKLPSPDLYFLDTSAGSPDEWKNWQRVQELVYRARECGMMSVSEDRKTCTVTVKIMYADEDKTPIDGKVLKEYLETVRESKDESTGTALSDESVVAKLKAYLDEFSTVTLQEAEVNVSNLAASCGLREQPVDPFDPNVTVDPVVLMEAQENHRRLCQRMAEIMLYRNPCLMEAMMLQLGAYAEIRQVIHDFEYSEILWNKRLTYVGTYSKIFIWLRDMFSIGVYGLFRYKHDGEKHEVINQKLMRDDLNAYSDWIYLQTGAYLADASVDNPVREDLEEMLNAKLKNFEQNMDDGVLSKEAVQIIINNANSLLDNLDDEINELSCKAHKTPALKYALDYAINFLQETVAYTTSEIRKLTRILKGL